MDVLKTLPAWASKPGCNVTDFPAVNVTVVAVSTCVCAPFWVVMEVAAG